MSVDEKEAAIRLVRRVLTPEEPAELVHHFLFVRVGNDFLLEAGYLDLVELKAAVDHSRETGTTADATLFISHRFQLSADAIRQLIAAGTQILASLPAPVEHEVTQ